MSYWFTAKKYGYGWVPATWQGWVILALYIVLSIHAFFVVDSDSSSPIETLMGFGPRFILLTAIFLLITYRTGEKPRWRWGK